MELKELLRKRAKLIADARAIIEKADKEERSRSSEEGAAYDAIITQVEAVNADIGQRQRLDSLAGVIAEGADNPGRLLLPHNEERNFGKYSILRALSRASKGLPVDGIEGEVSAELCRARGKGVRGNGFVMPLDIPVDMRHAALGAARYGTVEQRVGVLNTTTGTGSIPTHIASTFIELLRNRLIVRQAGATILTDMQGGFAIPRQTQAGTGYWVAESASPSASNQVLDQVAFTPKTAGAFTDISRRFAEMTNLDAENFVRADLTAVVSRLIDSAALVGTGSSNQPTGVINTSGVTVVALGTNGAAMTWAALVGLESALASANADMGTLAYITNGAVRGSLKTTTKVASSTFPVYLWDGSNMMNTINGYPVYVSNVVPSNLTKGTGTALSAMFYGNWADLIMAFWSGMDVIVDPYTGSTSGTLRIVVLQDVDINVRHPESFAVIKDIVTS